jgi:hypothetical protein
MYFHLLRVLCLGHLLLTPGIQGFYFTEGDVNHIAKQIAGHSQEETEEVRVRVPAVVDYPQEDNKEALVEVQREKRWIAVCRIKNYSLYRESFLSMPNY